MKQREVKVWKATHFWSETESLQVNKNRSRCGHMSAVTGKGSLKGPVNGEDSLRRAVGSLRAGSRELVGHVGRAARAVEKSRTQMPTVTGSTAAEKGWTAAQRSSPRSTVHERSSASFVPRIASNATITRWCGARGSIQRKPFDEGHGCESPCALREHHEVRQAIGDEPCQSHTSTSMKSFRRGVASVQTAHWVCQPDASSQGIQTHAEPLTCEVMLVVIVVEE